ncbi:MAG: PFL family protein [Vulcanimicrobiota bacterium]
MYLSAREVMETLEMIEELHLDIRTVTMGVNLLDCASDDIQKTCAKVVRKLLRSGEKLVETAQAVSQDFGIPIVNKRLSVTPISMVAAASGADSYVPLAMALDRTAAELGIDYLGGFSAPVHKGITPADRVLLRSLPEALDRTERVCSSISVASTKAGINLEALLLMGRVVYDTAHRSPQKGGINCGRLVVFCNQPEDNPFIAGAMHGTGEPDVEIHVGVSGPGVVKAVVDRMPDAPLQDLAEAIKQTAFKITRMGELAGREVSRRLGVPFGIVDLSLAPTPTRGDSVAEVLESMGLEKCGTHGTTAALALLNDAVKRGGAMASSRVGGLSGAFIPVSEDSEMARSVEMGALGLDKLEAMTAVCSVGLDMVAVPGDTPPETLTAIMADEMAIGMINGKTTAVRLIPVPGKKAGEWVDFGGLLGAAPIMAVHKFSAANFVRRGGRIPAPIQSLTN